MADVKIPISANAKSVGTEMKQVEKAVDGVGKVAGKLQRVKWAPFDLKQAERDLRQYEKLATETQRRIAQAARNAPAGAPGTLPPPPAAGVPAARGGGRGSRTYAPGLIDVPQHLISGIGGGFGQIASYGTRGALAGAYQGGIPGGAMGLMKGLGIGALAWGAFKVGQGINEGHEMAKERAGTLDALKRQMGDVGVSFERLKMVSEGVADGMQLNSKEAAELAKEFHRLSRSPGGPDSVLGGTRTAVGLSRAYGLDPSMGVQFFGGMANVNPRQNNKELALLIAEAVERSGGRAKADDVMQAMQSFVETTARMSLTTPNSAAFGGAYSQMVSSGIAGMTGSTASSILSQANSAVMGMGGAGDAGRNFITAAFNRYGHMNPLEAQALSEGGLFASRRSVFGPGTALGRFMGNKTNPYAGSAGYGVSNFQAIKAEIERSTSDKLLQANMAQNLFKLPTLGQAAAMMMQSGSSLGSLPHLLKRSGVDLKDVNETGIQNLAAIGGADRPRLGVLMNQMMGRTGKGALSESQKKELLAASGDPDTEKFRDVMIKIAAGMDREETDWTKIQDGLKAIENVQITTGDKLVPLTTEIRDYMGIVAEKIAPESEYIKRKKAEERARELGGGSGGSGASGGYGDVTVGSSRPVPSWARSPTSSDYMSTVMLGATTPLPANAAQGGATSAGMIGVDVNVSGVIKTDTGQVIRPEVTTSVPIPRGAGARSPYAPR